MAYKQVINLSLVTDKPKTLFKHIRDFLTATGLYNSTTGVGEWTITNSFYAVDASTLTDNDWVLLKTTGETGVWDFRVLMRVTSLGIQMWSGHGWGGLTTNTPTISNRIGASAEILATFSAWTAAYIYADKNFCAIFVRAGTATYMHRFGIAENVMPEYMAPLPILSATTSGSNKVMSVSDSSNTLLAVGNRVCLFDYTTGSENSQITANDTGTDMITVGANQYAYSTAGYICSFFPYLIDSVIAKLYYTSCYSFSNPTGPDGYQSYPFGYLCPTPNILSDAGLPNAFNQKFPAERVLLASTNICTSLVLPSWILLTKKRATEEETHTLGSDTYRYFNFYNDTTYGFLLKEG